MNNTNKKLLTLSMIGLLLPALALAVGIQLEYNGGEPIFEVIPVLSYLTIPAQLPADMLAYSGNLFTDLGLLITMTAGLPIGFVIIKKIIALVKVR